MPSKKTRPMVPAGRIALDTLRRFPAMPLKSLARYLVHHYGDLYNNDIEVARSKLRYWIGSQGRRQHSPRMDEMKKLRSDAIAKLPKSQIERKHDYALPPGLWLVLADVHVPFHEEKPIEAALQYGKLNKVEGILLNGDAQDCAALSFWPTKKRDFAKEVEATIDFLDFLALEFPKAKKVWKQGNHEQRLENYYMSHAPELIGMPQADLCAVLSLEERGWELLDSKQKITAGKLAVLHGHELRGGNVNAVNPARWLYLKAKSSAICAHNHRVSEHTEVNIKNDLVTCWSIGCLCDLHPDYNPHANNWGWGFAVINVEADGMFEVENRRILPNGKLV